MLLIIFLKEYVAKSPQNFSENRKCLTIVRWRFAELDGGTVLRYAKLAMIARCLLTLESPVADDFVPD